MFGLCTIFVLSTSSTVLGELNLWSPLFGVFFSLSGAVLLPLVPTSHRHHMLLFGRKVSFLSLCSHVALY